MIKLNKFLMMSVLSFGIVSSHLVAEDTTSGTIEAEVLSQSGSPLSGATVTLKSTAKGISRSTVSDNEGNVRFILLPPGSYNVSVAASGYNSLSDQIRVSVGDSSFDFVLESTIADMDEVVVTAGAMQVVDFNNTTTGISVDLDEIMETTPLERNLTSVILLAPGTAKGDSAFGNLASISGSSVAENAYLINGLDTTNFRNFTGSSTVPFEFYDIVEVKTGGYSAEYGKAIGGVINAITKSGSNEWKFGGNVYMSPKDMQDNKRDTDFAANRFDSRDSTTYNVYASGPIVKDKAFFYVLAQPTESTNLDTSVSGTTYEADTDETFYGAKLDYFVNDKLHLEYTYFTDERTVTELKKNRDVVTGVLDPAVIATTLFNKGGDNEIFKASYIVNDNLSMSAMVGKNNYNRTEAGTGDAYNWTWWPYPDQALGLAGTLVPSAGADSRDVFKFDLDYYFGNHHFRVGIENSELVASAKDFYSGTNAAAFTSASGYTGSQYACGGVYYRGYLSAGASEIVAGDDLRLRTLCSGGTFQTDQDVLYVQDSWDVTDRLNLNLGIRRTSYDNMNASGESFIKIDNQDALRLGLTYDLTGNGTDKLYASFGEYYLPVAANTNIRLSGAEYFTQQFCEWDGTGDLGGDFKPGIAPGSCGDVTIISDGTVPSAAGTKNANIDPMFSEEYIIGYSTVVNSGLFSGWDMNITYTERELASTIEDILIDHLFPDLMGTTNQIHQYVLTNPGEALTVYVDDLEETYTFDSDGFPKPSREYKGITLQLDRPWDGDWYARIAYTNSDTMGNYEGTVKSDNGQDDAGITTDFDFPEFMEGAYGKLPNHRKHNIKFSGARAIGNGWIAGVTASALSPRYYGCIGNYPDAVNDQLYDDNSWYCDGEPTPRGSKAQSNWVMNLDVMASYSVPVSRGDLTLKLDVFNIFNMDSVTDLYETGEEAGEVGRAGGNYLKPTNYQDPRRVRLSATYRF
ncbi:TonB-dependent receptor [Gammaproteobacteria bacterium]|nr:TonB-dependent receptor [Gammaproteobacteria bacterium]